MICEMCGQESESLTRVRVEGSVLLLCPNCQKFGKPLDPPPSPAGAGGSAPAPTAWSSDPSAMRTPPRARRMEERDLYKEIPEMEMAEDWPKRIRQAREKLTWTPEEFGRRLNEKKSLVLKIEAGHFRPPDQMVHKIEQLLKIRLRADPAAKT
jgi:putative transcription factor